MKAHSDKFMNVNDMQVPDEDDRVAAQLPPHDQSEQQDRERMNLDRIGHQQDNGTTLGYRH